MANKEPTLDGSRFKVAEASPGFLFWKVFNLWHRHIKSALAELDLTHGQYSVLAAISYIRSSQPHVSQQEIADQLSMDKMTLSDIVKVLTRKKLITKKPHSLDRRSFAIELTSQARSKMKLAVPAVEGVDEVFFNQLKEDQFKSFNRFLIQLAGLKSTDE